jgi:hypothetical protein
MFTPGGSRTWALVRHLRVATMLQIYHPRLLTGRICSIGPLSQGHFDCNSSKRIVPLYVRFRFHLFIHNSYSTINTTTSHHFSVISSLSTFA